MEKKSIVGEEQHRPISLIPEEGSQAERVSAELLAASLSKGVLAKEVLRLKQLRDELALDGGDGSDLLQQRVQQLKLEIDAEEERAMEEISMLAQEIAETRDALLSLHEGEEEAKTRVQSSNLNAPSHKPASLRQLASEQDMYISERWLREMRSGDARFIRKVSDLKSRLAETSVEFASPVERSTAKVRNFFRDSNARLRVVMDRVRAVPVERELHAVVLDLLSDNANLRMSINDYAEGLLANTFESLSSRDRQSHNFGRPHSHAESFV
eukprot:763596-Hanusia_phi.AAC.5